MLQTTTVDPFGPCCGEKYKVVINKGKCSLGDSIFLRHCPSWDIRNKGVVFFLVIVTQSPSVSVLLAVISDK